MRILFLSHYFWPEGNAPASRTYEHCQRWVQKGHSVTVITCAPNVPNGVVYEGYKNHLYHKTYKDGIEVIRIWTFLAANKGTSLRILNYLSYMIIATLAGLLVKKPTVVVATSPQFFAGWAGLTITKFRNIPFILEIRDIWPESIKALNAIKSNKIIHTLEWLERKIYQLSDHIVTVGQGYKDNIVKKGISPKKISIIMNGIDTNIFNPDKTYISRTLPSTTDGKFICSYIGTIGMASGLDIVINTAKVLECEGIKDIVFVLVGDGSDKERLENKANINGLNNIIFTGRVPKKEIPQLFCETDVCLVHLKNTRLFSSVMPSKIIEAAGMKKPIINGVSGFASEFVEKAKCGINIQPENHEQLKAALMHLRNRKELTSKMGQSGYEYVTDKLDRNNLAEQYIDIMNRVVITD